MLASRQLYILYNVSFTLTFPLFISYHELPSETTYSGSASPASVARKAVFFFPPCNGQSQSKITPSLTVSLLPNVAMGPPQHP